MTEQFPEKIEKICADLRSLACTVDTFIKVVRSDYRLLENRMSKLEADQHSLQEAIDNLTDDLFEYDLVSGWSLRK